MRFKNMCSTPPTLPGRRKAADVSIPLRNFSLVLRVETFDWPKITLRGEQAKWCHQHAREGHIDLAANGPALESDYEGGHLSHRARGTNIHGEGVRSHVDVKTDFARSVLEDLLKRRVFLKSDRFVVFCAGQADALLMEGCGLESVVLTGLDPESNLRHLPRNYAWRAENAESMSVADQSFDVAFVSDGLHHCGSPHRALLEMYRVARKGIVVLESRDSLSSRIAARLGLTQDYEVDAVIASGGRAGGVNNTEVPNFIYRWTEREFEKALKSFDPTGQHGFRYYYGLDVAHAREGMRRRPFPISLLGRASLEAIRVLTKLAPRQCNSFAMVGLRPDPASIHPWLRLDGNKVSFDPCASG